MLNSDAALSLTIRNAGLILVTDRFLFEIMLGIADTQNCSCRPAILLDTKTHEYCAIVSIITYPKSEEMFRLSLHLGLEIITGSHEEENRDEYYLGVEMRIVAVHRPVPLDAYNVPELSHLSFIFIEGNDDARPI
ncbi:hypothetical protein PROFUN_13409 [Planoprotostelium fungivorum]|uniref:Uncharacterized protein n=1 Tax=Planoprotostelium fungivorum TaxID=1890364 RepID=A0A2P6N3Q9_9EUKA|nr:hypothetical protein PROFUN_13409 [Planoprotostelium fungivorum]